MANVTRHRLLATNCILLNCIITTITLHFLFRLHFLSHLFFGLLFKSNLGKSTWFVIYSSCHDDVIIDNYGNFWVE